VAALQRNHPEEAVPTAPETAPRVSELVIDQFCDLLLESTVLENDRQASGRWLQRAEELAAADPTFDRWLSNHAPPSRPDWRGRAKDQNWDHFLAHLSGLTDDGAKLGLVKRLAIAVLRLRTLQGRYAEMLETDKRRAIYHFSYGLSHELNNPLANITTRAGVLLQSVSGSDQRQMLEAIIDNAARGSEMLGDLMLIARPPELKTQPTDLGELRIEIERRCQLWAGQYDLTVDIDWRLSAGTLLLDQSMLLEIFWALLRNSIEASVGGQTIFLCVEHREAMLRFQLRDQGPGLSPEAIQFAFDPFYSGREAGRGLGMGLPKAKRLAEIHGGSVQIANYPAGGCQVEFWVQAKQA
jgi:signal transduction histidine kinase